MKTFHLINIHKKKESSSANTLKLTIIKKMSEFVKAGGILNTCQEGQFLFLLLSKKITIE